MPTTSGNTFQDQPDNLVAVGVVLRAHGSDGGLRVQPETDNPQRFRKGARLLAGDRELHVERVQLMPDGSLLLRFAGIAARGDAAALQGATLYVPADEAPEAPPGTYYHYQLVGMSVEDEDGEPLGTLTEIIATGANDVYVVTGESAELLLPAVADVVVSVDVGTNTMTAAVPEGLAWRALNPPREKKKPRRRAARRPKPTPGG